MKRIMSLLLALAMLLSCAAAIAEESETVAIPEAKEGETVVEFWCGMWENWNQNWVKAQVDSWNAKEDRPFYVNLTWMDTSTMAQQLAAARAAEIAPDVYTTDYSSVANDYANGYTLDLTNLVSQSAWDDLLDSAKSFVTIHDALVAYPWMMEPSIVMYYDKEAFTSVGLDPESPPTTWDELIEYAEMLTTEDRFGMDIAASYNFWGWFYTNNNDQYMLTDDWSAANVNNESMKEFAEFYKTIRNSNYCSQTPLKDQNVGVYAVLEGRSAIAFSGSWGVSAIDTDYPEKRDVIGVAAAPTKDGSPMHATSGGWNLVVDAKAKHPTEAGQWIEYMLGDTSDPSKVADFFVAANFSKFTTRKSVSDYLVANTAASNDERVQTIQSDIMPYVVAEPTYAWEIFQYGLNAFDDIAINGTDIDTAFNDMEALINQYIADNNLAGKNPRAN